MKKEMPKIGDRIGFTWWPGDLPEDDLGTVVRIFSNNWYSNIAEVKKDSGEIETFVGGYSDIGVGAYLVSRQEMTSKVNRFDSMTTTAGAFSRQCVEFQMHNDGNAHKLVSEAAGGPIDAPNYIASGSVNSLDSKNTKGPIPSIGMIQRI